MYRFLNSKSDVDEEFKDHMERAKTWHQITVVAQVSHLLNSFIKKFFILHFVCALNCCLTFPYVCNSVFFFIYMYGNFTWVVIWLDVLLKQIKRLSKYQLTKDNFPNPVKIFRTRVLVCSYWSTILNSALLDTRWNMILVNIRTNIARHSILNIFSIN